MAVRSLKRDYYILMKDVRRLFNNSIGTEIFLGVLDFSIGYDSNLNKAFISFHIEKGVNKKKYYEVKNDIKRDLFEHLKRNWNYVY